MKGVEETRYAVGELQAACTELLQNGGRMVMAYGWFPQPQMPELCYLASSGAGRPLVLWRCRPEGPAPSLAPMAPLLGWYEREITDLCGIAFSGHPEPYPLALHEGANPVTPPLSLRYPAGVPMPYERMPPRRPEVEGSGIQELPFGPVRADIMESAQFLFFYIGEHILHFQPRLFFKHRGLEKRFEGLSAPLGVILAERVSGVGSVAHALAYCQAVEAACDGQAPTRARWLRVLLAELERLYNHLHFLGHLAETTTLKVGQAQGKLLEERVKQINARLTGSRLLRNLLTPGGLRRDIQPDPNLPRELSKLQRDIDAYVALLERTGSHIDCLLDTGVLSRQVAFDQGATGPIARASGLDRELRRDHPYAGYGEFPPDVPVREGGDAYARAQVRADEIDVSIGLIIRLLARLPVGPVVNKLTPPAGAEGLGWSESPRGSLYYAVHFADQGRLARVKIKSPSFSNWRVFPFTVHDSDIMDYAINEASFGLTVAGCDR